MNLSNKWKSFVNYQISVQHLEVLGGKIGSSDDGENLRDQVAKVTSSANTLSKETNALMKRLVELSNDQVSLWLIL